MKRAFISIIITMVVALVPVLSGAQVLNEPGLQSPNRIGFVNEFSGVFSGLTGKGASDYVAGGGVYYSGLLRSSPILAFGIHAGLSGATSLDGYGDIIHGVIAGEGRLYLPMGPVVDIWGSVVLGVGFLQETWSTNNYYTEEGVMRSGPVLGVGAGIGWYLGPNLSVGGYLRLYRLLWNDGDYVNTLDDGAISEADYYGLWWTLGGYVALHY
jgi:hypothetical protein